jgi:hypothetical protein
MQQVFAIIPLTLAFFVPFYYHFWHYQTLSYYQRFIGFSTGRISQDKYIDTFGSHIRRNYEIADLVRSTTNKNDKVFIVGDSSLLYALSKRFPPGKYVADYHIKDFSSEDEVMKNLNQEMPIFVIILPGNVPFPLLREFIRNNYGLFEEIDGAQIWKLLNPQVRALINTY